MNAELIKVQPSHVQQVIVTSPELAEEITRQCVESMVDAGDAVARFASNLRRAWEGQVWVPLGIATPEDWARQRLSPQAAHFSREQRGQVFVAVAGGGLLATSVLAAALDVSVDTVDRALKPIKQAHQGLRIEKIKRIEPGQRMRETAALVVSYHDTAAERGGDLGQVATAEAIGRSQSTVHAVNELLRAKPEFADQLRREGLPILPEHHDAGLTIDRSTAGLDQRLDFNSFDTRSMASTLLQQANRAVQDLLAGLDDLRRCIDDPTADTDFLYRADLAAVIAPALEPTMSALLWTARMLGVDAQRLQREVTLTWANDPRREALRFRGWWAWGTAGRVPLQILAENDDVDQAFVARAIRDVQALHPDRHLPELGACPTADQLPDSLYEAVHR